MPKLWSRWDTATSTRSGRCSEVGVEGVEAFLAGLVADYGLDRLSDDRLLAEAREHAPELATVLQR